MSAAFVTVYLLWFGVHPFDFILAIVLLLLANICFAKWPDGHGASQSIRALIRCILFGVLIGCLHIALIILLGSGQLGYGEYLRFDENGITPYGFKVIFSDAAITAGMLFVTVMSISLSAERSAN